MMRICERPIGIMSLERILEEPKVPFFIGELPKGIAGYTRLAEKMREIERGIIKLELYPKSIVLDKETYRRMLKGDVDAIKSYYHELGHEKTRIIYYEKNFSNYVDNYLELIAEVGSYIYLEKYGKLEDYLKKIKELFGKRVWADEYWMINILESYVLNYGTKYLDKLTEFVKCGSITMEDMVTYLTWEAGKFYVALRDIKKVLNFYRSLGWKVYESSDGNYVIEVTPKIFERYNKVKFLLSKYIAS